MCPLWRCASALTVRCSGSGFVFHSPAWLAIRTDRASFSIIFWPDRASVSWVFWYDTASLSWVFWSMAEALMTCSMAAGRAATTFVSSPAQASRLSMQAASWSTEEEKAGPSDMLLDRGETRQTGQSEKTCKGLQTDTCKTDRHCEKTAKDCRHTHARHSVTADRHMQDRQYTSANP